MATSSVSNDRAGAVLFALDAPPRQGQWSGGLAGAGHWLGLLVLVVWTGSWVLGTLLQPRYYQLRYDYISGLAAPTAEHPEVMRTGFLVTGTLLLLAAVMVYRAFAGVPADGWARRGALLLGAVGIGLAAAGLFTTDCSAAAVACTIRDELGTTSWHSRAHNLLAGGLAFFAVIPLAFVPSLWDRGQHRMALYSLLTAAPTFAGVVALRVHAWPMWEGLIQRATISAPLLWLAVFCLCLPAALPLGRTARRAEAEAAPASTATPRAMVPEAR